MIGDLRILNTVSAPMRSFVFVLLFSLCACSASGPKFQDTPFAAQPAPQDKARLIFYREFDANFWSVTLGIDDSIIGALAHRGFVVADTAPGDHKISAWVRYTPVGKYVIGMDLKAGESYYIRASHRSQRMLYPLFGAAGTAFFFVDPEGEFRLEALTATQALQDLENLKLSE